MSLPAFDALTPLSFEPDDFDIFWSTTRDLLLEVEPKPRLARQKPPGEALVYDHLQFQSLGNVGISGYLLAHDTTDARPLIVHSHGYNSQYDVMLHWANSGCHILGIDFRGFGRSERLPLAKGSYVLTGVQSPNSSILRGSVCDLVQALRVGRELLGARVSGSVLYGFSFGGAMALMASTLDKDLDLVVSGQPTFGWHSERLRLSEAGTGAELRRYLEQNHREKAKVMDTFSYFESMHFARRMSAPAFVGIGLDDAVVPSRSVIAICNQIQSEQFELRILPVSHSDDPRESLWAEFDNEWLEFVTAGLPDDFGSEARKLRAIETRHAAR